MEPQTGLETEATVILEEPKIDSTKIDAVLEEQVSEDIVKEIQPEKQKKGGHKELTEVSNLLV